MCETSTYREMKDKLKKLNACIKISVNKGYYVDVIILANQAKILKEKINAQ